MTEENNEDTGMSLSMPIGAIAAAAVLGLAAVAYTMLNREGDDEETSPSTKSKSSNRKRRLGLMTLATLIENDKTRKMLVTVIRAIAKRS